MPFASISQSKWGHSKAGIKALGGPDKVREWQSATDYKSLPDKVNPMADKPKKWMAGAIKDHSHPVVRAAQRKGISTLQEAEHESKSPNPHIRSRGILGITLIRR